MLEKHRIVLPRGLCANLTEEQMNEMVRVALSLGPLWENALGPDWKRKMTPDQCRELYLRM
jgi:3-deoxy-alpha-D-manno-octulosonate 8-oxidase